MKVTGFSFIRNAIKYDYPIVEAITSILPICDEFILAVGNSDDATLEIIKNINSPKIKIIHTIWDDSLREGGKVLAVETDKAFKEISKDSDWAFYIQGDEVVHEKYLQNIKADMLKWKDDKKVEGLLFKYKHFYGSYDYVGDSRKWYRYEVRIVRPNNNVFSYRDAQGFRIYPNQKLKVKLLDAYIYHYGWVKPPEKQGDKIRNFHKLWNTSEIEGKYDFDYSSIDSLDLFKETHPKVMEERIKKLNWKFDYPVDKKNYQSTLFAWLMWFERMTGYRIGEYRNFKLLK
ncbi:MAG: glycosyltransferase family 2 protein [Cytophagales bacterium]|nr:MAG: glycosyltransferase family 2 protein [Cytophagales bacterium]